MSDRKARAGPDARLAEITSLFLAMKPSPASLMWLGAEAAADRFDMRNGLGVVLPRHLRQGWRWRLRMVLAWTYAAARAEREGATEEERADAEEALRLALERFADFHERHVLTRLPACDPHNRQAPPPLPLPHDQEASGHVVAFPTLNPRSA
jgi:hypothetical protein